MKKLVLLLLFIILLGCHEESQEIKHVDSREVKNVEMGLDSHKNELEETSVNDLDKVVFEVSAGWGIYNEHFSEYEPLVKALLTHQVYNGEAIYHLEKGLYTMYFIKDPEVTLTDFDENNLNFSKVLINVDDVYKVLDINHTSKILDEYSMKDKELDILMSNIVYITSIDIGEFKRADSHINSNHPIISNDRYLGGLDGSIFYSINDLDLPKRYSSLYYVSKHVTGGEKMTIVVDGEIVGIGIADIPVLYNGKSDPNRYLEVKIENDVGINLFSNYIAISADWELRVGKPSRQGDTYVIDIDNDGVNEIFVSTNNDFVLSDEKFSYITRPLVGEFKTEYFPGFFLDLNGDGYLEHVQIDTYDDGTTITMIYDFRKSIDEYVIKDIFWSIH